MTPYERRREAMSHAFRYQAYKAEVAEYVRSAMTQTGKQQLGGTPVSSGHRSDPTARAAIKLADMPEHIRTKALWVAVVNDAWKECIDDDNGDPYGLAFILERNFRLTGETLGPEHNASVRSSIRERAGMNRTTFYNRLEEVGDILVYHAVKRKLL